jgi:hypothetical protein
MVLSGRKQGSFLEGKRFLLCLQQKWFWGAWQCVTSRGEGLSEPGGDFPSFAQALSVTCLCIRRNIRVTILLLCSMTCRQLARKVSHFRPQSITPVSGKPLKTMAGGRPQSITL